jgi:hypothetical protein
MNISHEDERKPYRPPEMAGAEYVPPPDARAHGDDVMRQPGTIGAFLLAAGLVVGLGLLYLGSRYEPSRITQSQAPITTPAPIPD